jgi:hypothetical protein
MLGPVVQQVTPLAQRFDIAVPASAVAGIVVEMGRCQHDLGRPYRHIFGQGRRGDPAASSVAPSLLLLVPPAAVTQMLYDSSMRRSPWPARTGPSG